MNKGEQTKERLLEMATQLVSQKGVGATSVSELLLAAGVKKGTLYYHFPGKDELCLAVLERMKVMYFSFFDAKFEGFQAIEGFEAYFEAVLERQKAKGFVGGCIFGNTALEMSDSNSGYAAAVQDFFQMWMDKLALIIRRGQKEGGIRDDLPAKRIAQMIVASIEGGIMLSRLRKEEEPLRNCLKTLKDFLKPERPLKPA